MPLIGDGIADADLVLEDQEESADQVADQRLRAESERDAHDAGAGQRRRDVDAELAQDHQRRDADDERRRDVREHAAQRARALGSLERVEPGAEADVVLEPLDPDADHADDHVGHEAMSSTRSPESNAQPASVCRWTPARGRTPAISKAGTIRTPNTSRKTAMPISRSGVRTSGLVVGTESRNSARRAAPMALRASREAIQARMMVGTTTATTTCQFGTATKNRVGISDQTSAPARRAGALVYRSLGAG